MSKHSEFRDRLRSQALLAGTFSKTPSAIVHEVLGRSVLDCVCIDAEHHPFDRGDLDACIAALRAADMPALVRVPIANPQNVLQALDCGATGIVAPHVTSAEVARALVQAAHYPPLGQRGYAGSTRAADYGTKSLVAHLRDSAATTTLVAQIEDADALAQLDAIAAVEGIDCLFVGRMDLTISLGCTNATDSKVVDAVQAICAAGRRANKAVGMFVPPGESLDPWIAAGASFYLLGSEQAFMLDGARALLARLCASPGRS